MSSGSYYLVGDLTSSGWGIHVNADDVTIDLMGYTLMYEGTEDAYGIYIYSRNNVEIRNGTVRDFTVTGIYEQSSGSTGHRIVGIRALSNGHDGIRLRGYNHLVKDCHATGNAEDGIDVGSGSTISENMCCENGEEGIDAGDGSTLTGNTCCYNSSYGLYAGDGSTISGNTSRGNDLDGISAGWGSSVLGNTSRYNQNWGIYLVGDNFVAENAATDNNQSGGAYGNMNSSASSTYGLNHAP
jgi:hypothetical protein